MQMQPFQTSALQVRPVGAISRASSPPAECIKAAAAQVVPATRLAVGGRIAHPAATAVHAVVRAAPTPTTSSRAQSHFPQLPKFQPPSFHGADGTLPCPESPASTPRHSESELPSVEPNGEQDKSAGNPLQGFEAFAPVEQWKRSPSLLYAVGSFVEYKSRSSGSWILAKVEGFNTSDGTYRLDVQPHAKAERVRPRGGGTSTTVTAEQWAEGSEKGAASELSDAAAPAEGVGYAGQLRSDQEVESLRRQVALLCSENAALREQVRQEITAKEGYIQELRMCHQQLQQAWGHPGDGCL